MNTLNKADKKIEQGTTVYHKEYGKGSIIYVQYRTKDSLCMCYFPKAKVHDWVTEKELLVGTGDVTLHRLVQMHKRINQHWKVCWRPCLNRTDSVLGATGWTQRCTSNLLGVLVALCILDAV